MKKISVLEATGVVGGNCKTCVSEYQNVTAGGVTSCKMITSCTDKHGTKTTLKDADPSNCGVLNNLN